MNDQNRRTPPWLFRELEKYVGHKFTIDLAACAEDALCKKYYTAENSALVQKKWPTNGYCNPPFKLFDLFLAKAVEQYDLHGVETCLVGPTGCSQAWFHRLARRFTILLPQQRIVFYASDGSGPTRGADRDTMIYLIGSPWAQRSKGTAGSFNVLVFENHGMVVTTVNAERLGVK